MIATLGASNTNPLRTYKAFGNFGHTMIPQNRAQDNSSISLGCSLIDKVIHLTTPFSPKPVMITSSSQAIQHLHEFNNKALEFYEEALSLGEAYALDPYPYTEQSLDEALWRTLICDRTKDGRPAPYRVEEDIKIWAKHTHTYSGRPTAPEPQEFTYSAEQQRILVETTALLGIYAFERRFCVTEKGYLGIVPPKIEVGDSIYVVFGAQTPYVLRSAEGDDSYRLVGECYVHGLMVGEAITIQSVRDDLLSVSMLNIW